MRKREESEAAFRSRERYAGKRWIDGREVEALLGGEQVDEIWQLNSFDDFERAAVPPTSPRSKDAATFPRDDFAEPELTCALRTQSRPQSTLDEQSSLRLLSASKRPALL
jgi:hypothetical protein